MGILAMNIVGFAMPSAAYLNPRAYGLESAADMAAYAISFVLVDGKMRGLFSFLFGASMLLVIQRCSPEQAGPVTYRRLAWLLLFGLLHFYLIWYGDILVGYALTGMVAYLFHRQGSRRLVGWALALLVVQLAIFSLFAAYLHQLAAQLATDPTPAVRTAWDGMTREVAVPTAAQLAEAMALYRGSYANLVEHQLTSNAALPLVMTAMFFAETLAYMLLGMAALKSGLLTGGWSQRSYRRWALVCLALVVPLYLVCLVQLFHADFSPPAIFTWSFAATVPLRPPMIVAYACLIILVTRRRGALVERIAAVGRAAFSNYLGTSILMTFLFYGWGLGLFGQLSRAQLYLVVVATWLLMLLWSKPWLDRFRYGPMEWLWRSLARGHAQPMRRLPAAA